jgi:hypothetical protein
MTGARIKTSHSGYVFSQTYRCADRKKPCPGSLPAGFIVHNILPAVLPMEGPLLIENRSYRAILTTKPTVLKK